MIRSITLALLAATVLTPATIAQVDLDEDELVRLPGQGEVRGNALRDKTKAKRLKPGGGLFVTFDTDANGRISQSEIAAGIPLAFAAADANQDGYLTALEQQDWARSLPTRDDSLANPVRFDPNLDRRVDPAEFAAVISDLGREYANEATGEIIIAELEAPLPKRDSRRDEIDEILERERAERTQPRRNQSFGD